MEEQCTACGVMTADPAEVEIFPADNWIRELWVLCPTCLEERP